MFFAHQNNERSSLAQTELSSSRDRRWSLGGTTYHFGKSHLGLLPAPQRLIHLKPPEPTIFGGMKMLSYDFHCRAALYSPSLLINNFWNSTCMKCVRSVLGCRVRVFFSMIAFLSLCIRRLKENMYCLVMLNTHACSRMIWLNEARATFFFSLPSLQYWPRMFGLYS